MNIGIVMIYGIMLIPIFLFGFEFYLCKKQSNMALILPIIAACFVVLVGIYAICVSSVMFGIYFIVKYINDNKCEKQSELDKMNIQDL